MRCTDNLFIYATYPSLSTIFKLSTTSCESTLPVATYIKCTEGFVDITSYTLLQMLCNGKVWPDRLNKVDKRSSANGYICTCTKIILFCEVLK